MKKLTLTLTLIASLFLISCSSDDDGTDSPLVIAKNKQYPVNFTINIGEVEDIDLLRGDVSKVISEPRTDTDKLGYKGFIVYSTKDLKVVTAFDLACPNCWDGTLLVKQNNPTNRYECKVCGLAGYVEYGFGSIKGQNKVIDFVKYEVTKKDGLVFEVSNPK